jgi:hypothetical protein
MRVTDESIAQMPRVESVVLSERHWDTLQQKHRALLERVRDLPDGTEYAEIYDLTLSRLSTADGIYGDNRVVVKNHGVPHIIIHNHADCTPISLEDFSSFIKRPFTVSIQAVGHDGSVSVLEKLPNYNAAKAIHEYIKTLDKVDNIIDADANRADIVIAIETFLNSLNSYGFKYRRWTP